MARVYSTRILVEKGLHGAISAIPDEGTVLILRDLWVFWNPVSLNHSTVHLIGDVGQTISFFEFDLTSPTQTGFWQGRQVVETSVTITADGDPVDVSLSGYALTLP